MKKFLFICLLILGLSAQSQVFVQRQEAINIACRFLQYDNALRGNPDGNVQLSYIIRNDDTLMYVVDVLDKSVLIPRTKSCPAIMGYWQRENTNINDTSYLIHHVLGKYINGYCDYIENSIRTRNSNIAPAWNRSIDALQNRNNVVIGPLLSSNWGQSISNDSGENVDSNAYNYYVDTVSENGKVCMAGCVAVAIGQIMNYWKYPIYRSNRSADHQFDWCNMADKLTTTSPNYISERNAVARLLRDCGEAVRMNYCFSGVASFAFPHMALRAFVDTFDYSEDADLRRRWLYTDADWKQMLIDEMENKRPVFYANLTYDTAYLDGIFRKEFKVSELFNGHAFVCDGYDYGRDLFHFNFGWNGSKDTWLAIDSIYVGSDSYFADRAIFNIKPINQDSFCDYDLRLNTFYEDYYNENSQPIAYQNVPKVATQLTSVPINEDDLWRTIPTGASSEYVAHRTVVIQPGFHAEKGSEFVAKIVPCPNCDNRDMELSDGSDDAENDAGYDDSAKGEKGAMFEDKDMESVFKDGERLFPNPSKDRITYRGKEVNRVFVYDMAGKPVFRWFIVSKTDDEVTIDIKNIEAGTYLLYVVNNDSSRSAYKFVKK